MNRCERTATTSTRASREARASIAGCRGACRASKSTSPLDPSCKLNSAGLIVNRVVKQQIEELVYSGEVDDEERADWLERKALFEASLQERQDEQARVRRQAPPRAAWPGRRAPPCAAWPGR